MIEALLSAASIEQRVRCATPRDRAIRYGVEHTVRIALIHRGMFMDMDTIRAVVANASFCY